MLVQLKLVVKWRNGRGVRRLSHSGRRCSCSMSQWDTVMACTMRVLCGIAAQLVLEGVLDICGMHAGDSRADTGAARAMGLGLVKGSFLGFSGIEDRE